MKEKLQSLNIIATVFIIIMLVFICYKLVTQKEAASEGLILYNYSEEDNKPVDKVPLEEATKEEENVPQTFRLYITGAVKSPGVYEIEEGKRIVDLIELAGGALENANLGNINLAAYVEDAKHVKIPVKTEEGAEEIPRDETWYQGEEVSEKDAPVPNNGLININDASLKELTALPGIGNVIGQNIINYRQAKGPFKSIEEIKNVSRIGSSVFDEIKDKITVE